MNKQGLISLASILLALSSSSVLADGISDDVIRIGFITDMSGVYADGDGPGGAEAIRMAIADVGGVILGKKSNCLWPIASINLTFHQRRLETGLTTSSSTC